MTARFGTVVTGLAAVTLAVVVPHRGLSADGFVWVEAEDFAEKGDWVVETQFTHKMGSAYLLCPGPDSPREKSARTSVRIPKDGTWTVWARTKDWLPEFSPGKFALLVGGRESAPLGVSKRTGWVWEKVGAYDLKAGDCALELRDLSGAYARCDAVLLTADARYSPPEEAKALEKERARLAGVDLTVSDAGTFEVVIVGAGPGGMGAALAAARTGAKTALVFDRPVPGGNASKEWGVDFDGAALAKKNSRESGIVEEIRQTRRGLKHKDYSETFDFLADREKGLSRFPNERVMRVEKDGKRIVAVISRNTLTGRWRRWLGRQFIDSTGDGWIGFFAGARTMYGREAGAEFKEEWIAPKEADRLTMSGTLGGPFCRRTKKPVAYETPVWARIMPKGFDRKVSAPIRPWWLEAPGRIDDVDDPEAARDHLIRINFAYFGWLKNEWERKDLAANHAFCFPLGFNGRREGMRIVGDYILTANDCRKDQRFPDRVMHGGWSIDTHDPLGMDNPHGDGWWHPHMWVDNYSVPYRALYAADVDNLFMGSRCESMTHMALGSMRVQGTQATAGQVVGTAAALCIRYGLDPRALGKTRIGELQQLLLKDDVYILGMPNADPADLARTAKASAPELTDGYARTVGKDLHCWVSEPSLPQAASLEFAAPVEAREVRLAFDTDLTPQKIGKKMPAQLVKDYAVEVKCGGTWTKVADEKGNYLRHRVHRFDARKVTAVRVTVTATWGDPSARIFEIRVY